MRITKKMIELTRTKGSCPHCKVRAGAHCKTPGGKTLLAPHQVRIDKYVAKLQLAAKIAKEDAKLQKALDSKVVQVKKPKLAEVKPVPFKHVPVLPPPKVVEVERTVAEMNGKVPWVGKSAVAGAMCPRCLRLKGEECLSVEGVTHPERIAAYARG